MSRVYPFLGSPFADMAFLSEEGKARERYRDGWDRIWGKEKIAEDYYKELLKSAEGISEKAAAEALDKAFSPKYKRRRKGKPTA